MKNFQSEALFSVRVRTFTLKLCFWGWRIAFTLHFQKYQNLGHIINCYQTAFKELKLQEFTKEFHIKRGIRFLGALNSEARKLSQAIAIKGKEEFLL